jgi:serine/threonine protein kinase
MVSEYALIIYIVSGIVSSAIILGFVLSSKRSSKEEFKSFQILSIESPKLFVNEWGKILVKVKGKGKVSINLEGNVEWKDPGINEISGESTIEIPVKPKVSGDIPVKVIIDTPYGKEFSTILLKVERKEVKPLELPVPIIDKGKVPEIVDIIPLRNMSLKNLVSGYGCSSKLFKVNLSSSIVPKEFEGAWDCCLLGCGGWGCAYLCVRGENKVVIKLPRGFEAIIERSIEAPTSHEAFLKKIKSEAEIMGSLNHPNIIKLLGVSNRVPLVIYEFADYGSLYWQLIKGWKPSLRDVVLIGIQLGDALRYIHSRGLIHGDIKPSNVFIKNGIAKLGDFSSTVKLLSSVSISKMVYTIGFRAPEQVYYDIRKKARELGIENRIDIYQLGNLLLYVLTGESIDGEEAGDDKLLMEKLNGISNEDLKQILVKALALEPEKRPSAEDLTKMLYTVWNKL